MAQAKRVRNIARIQMRRRVPPKAMAIIEFLGGFALLLMVFVICIMGPEIAKDVLLHGGS